MRVKAPRPRPAIVAVITSASEWKRAAGLRRLPDFFELRLDALGPEVESAAAEVARLRAPLIITARHPAEGGARQLDADARRDLLLRFLPQAAFVDVELRAAVEMKTVLANAGALGLERIISVHELNGFPALRELRRSLAEARRLNADIFKLAVRTDTPEQLSRLLAFFAEAAQTGLPISAMGLGRLGRTSRVELARRGSVLNYVHLGRAAVPGQLSLAAMRRILEP